MAVDLLITGLLYGLGLRFFGHFERHTALARRVRKVGIVMGVTALLSATVGRPWSLLWVAGIFGAGLTFHVWWTLRHGIHPLTAEPRDKYYALRGWALEEA